MGVWGICLQKYRPDAAVIARSRIQKHQMLSLPCYRRRMWRHSAWCRSSASPLIHGRRAQVDYTGRTAASALDSRPTACTTRRYKNPLQCFDIVVWVMGRTSGNKSTLHCKTMAVPFLPKDKQKVRGMVDKHTYTVSQKKQDTKLLPITSPNVNRFSKFFHWQTHW